MCVDMPTKCVQACPGMYRHVGMCRHADDAGAGSVGGRGLVGVGSTRG